MTKLPPALQGESLKRLAQGIALGAVGAIIVGFYWGGWTLGSTAQLIKLQNLTLANWGTTKTIWVSSGSLNLSGSLTVNMLWWMACLDSSVRRV